jgi:hypothetical protein
MLQNTVSTAGRHPRDSHQKLHSARPHALYLGVFVLEMCPNSLAYHPASLCSLSSLSLQCSHSAPPPLFSPLRRPPLHPPCITDSPTRQLANSPQTDNSIWRQPSEQTASGQQWCSVSGWLAHPSRQRGGDARGSSPHQRPSPATDAATTAALLLLSARLACFL